MKPTCLWYITGDRIVVRIARATGMPWPTVPKERQ